MKTKRYPISVEFNQEKTVGFVELFEDTQFTMLDVLAPAVSVQYKDPETGKTSPTKLLGFGLIKGDNYPKDSSKIYRDIKDIKDKNCNE